MTERTVLVLSGGGALGAYQYGIYRAVVKHMDSDALRAMVIVGASIGAVNGFLIASRMQDPDSGVGALERFWRNVSLPSAPFLPKPPRSGSTALRKPSYRRWWAPVVPSLVVQARLA